MANIISENHELNNIAIGGDQDIDRVIRRDSGGEGSDGPPPGMEWDAREYGISREEAQRRFDEANTPERRQQVVNDLKKAAQQRANVDVIDGKIAIAAVGTNDWHTLGTRVDQAMTAKEAMELSQLDKVRMDKEPVMVSLNGETVEVPGVYAITKTVDDRKTVLSATTVGEKYHVIQVNECFDFMDEVMSDYGAKYDSVGSLNGGRKIFLSVKMPSEAEPVRGDKVENYSILTNSYDGSSAMQVFNSNYRPICENTVVQAFSNRNKGIAIMHTQNATSRITEAKKALGLVADQFNRFTEIAENMANVQVDPKVYANVILDSVIAVGAIKGEDAQRGAEAIVEELPLNDEEREVAYKKINRLIRRRKAALKNMMDRYESSTNTAPGTLWAAFNAVTEYANHALQYRGDKNKQRETRFDSIIAGRANELNQAAYEQASSIVLAS